MNITSSPSYTLTGLKQEAACCVPQAHLAIAGLSVRYGAKVVLAGVSLDIQRGCITALIGPSGCGKTSLLSVLNRLTDMVPGATVRGSVRFDGVQAGSVAALELGRDYALNRKQFGKAIVQFPRVADKLAATCKRVQWLAPSSGDTAVCQPEGEVTAAVVAVAAVVVASVVPANAVVLAPAAPAAPAAPVVVAPNHSVPMPLVATKSNGPGMPSSADAAAAPAAVAAGALRGRSLRLAGSRCCGGS